MITINITSTKKEVDDFLKDLNSILNSDDFNIDKNLIVIKSKKENGDILYSTPYTLLDLEYGPDDIVERLKELTIKNYSETKLDKDNPNPPLLFVFGKDINNKQVYIKLKTKGIQNRHVLCVSFHYAKCKMTYPYA